MTEPMTRAALGDQAQGQRIRVRDLTVRFVTSSLWTASAAPPRPARSSP
jgi:hypothetical protein